MNDPPTMGMLYTTRANGTTITVRVLGAEQDVNRDRRKWVCENTATGRKVRRTTRQLHKLYTVEDYARDKAARER